MTMPLSEAIRLGAMLKPQAFGHFVTRSFLVTSLFGERELCWTGPERTCALGAALDATGQLWMVDVYPQTQMSDLWPVLSHEVQHPRLPCRVDLATVVVWLNDQEHWSREAIADLVEEVEAQVAREQAAQGVTA